MVATLPQLARLDGREVSRSERIAAVQRHEEVRREIEREQEVYRSKRVRGTMSPWGLIGCLMETVPCRRRRRESMR